MAYKNLLAIKMKLDQSVLDIRKVAMYECWYI